MADVELLQAEIEALRAEVERANGWNERVSVCRDHVADIVDGPCVICALDAAEARADNLQRELERLTAFNDDTCESFNRLSVERTALITRAEQLAEALREWWSGHRPVGWTEDQHRACPYVNLPTGTDKALAEAMLRDQGEG